MMTAVSIAVSQVDSFHTTVKDSVLSGPHAPTTGQARSPAPAGRTGLLALLGTLYEYTSILQEPGGQAQEESAG